MTSLLWNILDDVTMTSRVSAINYDITCKKETNGLQTPFLVTCTQVKTVGVVGVTLITQSTQIQAESEYGADELISEMVWSRGFFLSPAILLTVSSTTRLDTHHAIDLANCFAICSASLNPRRWPMLAVIEA
jgi:hypothetical protein